MCLCKLHVRNRSRDCEADKSIYVRKPPEIYVDCPISRVWDEGLQFCRHQPATWVASIVQSWSCMRVVYLSPSPKIGIGTGGVRVCSQRVVSLHMCKAAGAKYLAAAGFFSERR